MERTLAVLIDFENIATGCEKEGLGRFDVRIVMRRLKDKGRILVSRSYADWGRWSRFKLDLVHEGVTMCELTSHGMQSKNRADIALAVDAMELAYTRTYVDTFVILSGDSDFTPLVMRLKELNKRVIGCGTRGSTSRLIAETCDEFFFYDTLRDESRTVPVKKPAAAAPEMEEDEELTLDEALELLVETLENLQRDEPGAVHASVLKASMKRKEPTFSEVELGVRTFAQFLEAAQQKGLVRLYRDDRAGGFRVDIPQTAQEEPTPPPRREPTRTLSPDAQRLQGLLAEAGLEIGEPRERRIIVEQFVHVCGERAKRNRTCAVQFVLGDLLRRTKEKAPEIAPRTVKAVTHALRRAGLLIHPNGDAALSSTAPFVAPESASQLLDDLHAAGLRALQSRGETPDDTVLTELFFGGAEAGRPAGERVEPTEARAPERDVAPAREAAPEREAPPTREAAGREAREPRESEEPREGRDSRDGREGRDGGRRRGRRGGRDRRAGESPPNAAPPEDDGWPARIGEPAVRAVPTPPAESVPEADGSMPSDTAPSDAAPAEAPAAEPARRKPAPRRKKAAVEETPVEAAPVAVEAPVAAEDDDAEADDAESGGTGEGGEGGEGAPERKRRRRGGRRGRRGGSGESAS